MSFPILGLTGPSGAGKGVVAKRLSVVHGFAWIDTDAVYHGLISAPSACLDELVEAFGKDILTPDGALHRPALAAIVFDPENKDKLELLNAITHKHVLAEVDRQVKAARAAGAKGAVIDAPLLFESGADKSCTHTAAVLADRDIRLSRIMARDGLTLEAAQKRLDAQKSDDFYIERADYILENNCDISVVDAMLAFVDALAKELV